MKRKLHAKRILQGLFIISLILLLQAAIGQETRSYDGLGNNVANPEWGAVGANQLSLVSNGFTDGISEPAGKDRPNPRWISNSIFNQDGLLPDALGLSDYAWVWGQFIDHDITLVPDNPNEAMEITIPKGDPYFDPASTGTAVIHMHRSDFDPNSGTDLSNPRVFPNRITAFIDASAVYGSDEYRADYLRSFVGGKLNTSEGNLLPYNTLTGEFDGEIDPDAPEMAMAMPFVTKWFVAGDVRANENPLLTSMHTLFVREHNRLCEELITKYPHWTDEQLYQKARRMVGGMIQAIVYHEWLPLLGVHMPEYTGYKDDLEVGIMNVFSAAAYRYGHTVINSNLLRMDNQGFIVPQGNILLRNAFFNPNAIQEVAGIDPYLKGMTTQIEQDFDCKMINDLRNFLFGAPGSGGLDLASMNINRGRERGLPDYNTIREEFGMARISSFDELTTNDWLNQTFESVYGNIDDIDPWVGFLSEDHMSSALFGQSVMKIMELQFTILRDGDRFYYQNDDGLTLEEKEEIGNTVLSQIVKRNTGVKNIQDNIFVAALHTSIADVQAERFKLDIYPNPSSGAFFINIGAMESGEAVLSISDMVGSALENRKVMLQKGMNTISFDIDDYLLEGIYQVRLTMDNKTGYQKVFLNRN